MVLWAKFKFHLTCVLFYVLLLTRIDKLDFALRSLQAQHQVSETENIKRSNLLEQSTTALSLLENENTKLKKVSYFS